LVERLFTLRKRKVLNMSTPMTQQIAALKREAGGAILLTRLGDFYELQGQDAILAAPILEILLTTRSKGTEAETPMCGMPYHALDQYLPKLLAAGYSVAIAEPTAKPEEVKGLLPRAIARIITPGTWLDDDTRWLAALHRISGKQGANPAHTWALAMLQLASGKLKVIPGEGEAHLQSTLERLAPQELILAESTPDLEFADLAETARTRLPDWRFEHERAKEQILSFFGWQHLEGVGLDQSPAAICALGVLLDHIEATQKSRPAHIQGVDIEIGASGPLLDATSARHLEIDTNSLDGTKKNTLLNLLDTCKTRMGSRTLKTWLEQPLRDRDTLEERWSQVRWLTDDSRRIPLQRLLAQIPDIERLLGRVALGVATPSDLAQVRTGLQHAQKIPHLLGLEHPKKSSSECGTPTSAPAIQSGQRDQSADAVIAPYLALHPDFFPVEALALWPEGTPLCSELRSELERTLEETPPADIDKGGVIRSGVSPELDAVIRLATDAKRVMLELEEGEKKRSGVQSLKVKYNRVFGYYFEITKANLASVPKHFIRKQTLANAERFTTERLMDFEQRLLNAEADRHQCEEALFKRLLATVIDNRSQLRVLAKAIAKLDVICALAENARQRGWVKPEISTQHDLVFVGARHPMLESRLGHACIPNDLTLEPKSPMAVVTGPNMGGKSTYLRMAAILVVMAQIGSFVPAEIMRFGIVDRIFTRIGASDHLSKGQSTFMVEMTETARILNQASPASLVILDEIGRGTSTRDGLALAEAIAVHLRDFKGGAPRTLFATHYFELTKLAEHPKINNLHVEVQEWEDQLHFLHRIAEGPADRSYGIQVARLAGLPKSVITKAQRIIAELPDEGRKQHSRRKAENEMSHHKSAPDAFPPMLQMFEIEPDPIRQEIEALDIDNMTPLEALSWLSAKRQG
jgi:DNA mismatch repair protein MutS